MTTPRHDHDRPHDEGAALILVVLVTALVMVLGTTLLAVTVNNLSATRRAQVSATSLDTADAGVTQALAYLRSRGAGELRCSPTCTGNSWGNKAAPTSYDLPGATDQRYQVWIEPIPTSDPQFYRVHSRGLSDGGVREVQVDVELTLLATKLPIGIFARSVQGGGSAAVTNESVYSTGCVWNRSKIASSGTDAWTGLPSAVHTSNVITNSNGTNADCAGKNDKKAIHASGKCNSSYPYDHDQLGGVVSGSACDNGQKALAGYNTYYRPRDLDGNGTTDVQGSYIRDTTALRDLFNIDDGNPLSVSQREQLKAVARQQGTYSTSTTGWNQPVADHAVLYFDLAATEPGGVVDLKDITAHRRASGATNLSATSAQCKTESLIIVIEGGNARLNGNPDIAATLVLTGRAPYGEVIKANGTAGLIGTVFADKINMVGNLDLSLDACFVKNLAPSLYTASVTNYLEVDRT